MHCANLGCLKGLFPHWTESQCLQSSSTMSSDKIERAIREVASRATLDENKVRLIFTFRPNTLEQWMVEDVVGGLRTPRPSPAPTTARSFLIQQRLAARMPHHLKPIRAASLCSRACPSLGPLQFFSHNSPLLNFRFSSPSPDSHSLTSLHPLAHHHTHILSSHITLSILTAPSSIARWSSCAVGRQLRSCWC
ncbi:hypothetical protein BDY17DRAFT_132938 [Neohortaea acidophila]|uniref:Uncharacterized protein n=1 Tax=Neohortaea acidophila TaxID=245834 RepID=A0A6A6PXB1_9PEZI|nr:uncharacterized protein BDY17DRAFT_132938 [Neohortaea acidophila]KAF2484655.1 hypothetical protein BDY17DRAFT_132938 [Neohortaea acidophila]